MKLGFPWSVKGIRPEAREPAIADAQGADGAYNDELASLHRQLGDIMQRLEQISRVRPAAQAPQRNPGNTVDQAAHSGRQKVLPPAPAMPSGQKPLNLDRAVAEITARRQALAATPARVFRTAAKPETSTPQPSMLAEATRPKPAPAPDHEPPPLPLRAPLPAQDLSGLEGHLSRITDQIETLRQPGIERAINALRNEISEMARTLNQAMPRQAIDAIEMQIADLNRHIAEGRQAGVEKSVLAGIERGLADIRGALHALTPAESLVGYNETVAGLAHKIDLFVAQKDPAVFQQLESAITTLRGMVAHVASNDTVSQLAAEVQALGEKIDHLPLGTGGNDALTHLNQRVAALADAMTKSAQNVDNLPPQLEALVHSLDDKIDQLAHIANDKDALIHLGQRVTALADAITASAQNGHTVSPQLEELVHSLDGKIEQIAHTANGEDALTHLDQRIATLTDAMAAQAPNGNMVSPQLEALVHSLSEKIEQVQSSHGNDVALGHLEDRIVTLVQKLDASESLLGQLEAIERGLSDLLVHVGEMRANNKQAEALHADSPPAMDELKQEIARTQDALENVHSTLGLVVDRLAMIERGIRNDNHARRHDEAPALSVGKLAARADDELTEPKPVAPPRMPQAASLEMPMPQAAPEPASSPSPPQLASPPPPPRRRAATSLPIVPDQPLEPGSGPPKFSDRIAASQAALGEAAPSVDEPSGKSSFIAAARRAAQAAMQQTSDAAAPSIAPKLASDEDQRPSLRGKVMKRMKSLVIAASIIAIVLGSFQIVGSYFKLGGLHKFHKSDSAKTGEAATGKTAIAGNSAPSPRPVLAAKPTLPAESLALSPTPLTAAAGIGASPLSASQTAQQVPSLPSTPLLGPPPATATAKSDVTGSIPETAASHPTAAGKTSSAVRKDLPLAIGGPRLRKAASANNADADYEVGLRFAEGRGVPVNLTAAAHWFALAAHQGLAPAQFRYASMLEKGLGVNKDLEAARRLYLAAAEQGHAKAMHNLAVLYAEGANGKPDYGSAVKWFRKAAQHGIADSQYNLGVLTARGLGTAQNYATSYKWFALAAAQGDKESAKKRDEIATHLDAKELAAAKQAVASFKIVPQPLAAIIVPKPQGGWDTASAAAAPAKAGAQPPHPRRLPPHPDAHAPLSLGSFAVGNR